MTAAIRKLKNAVGRVLSAVQKSRRGGRSASLAYRMNRAGIKTRPDPKKYTRLLDFISGDRIIELGAAEGVLALLLAERGAKVYAFEMKRERHEEALRLQDTWQQQGRNVQDCEMILGDIRNHLDLLKKVDTLVAVRSIYYLRDDIERVFLEVGRHVDRVVLCGNEGRSHDYYAANGQPNDKLGRFNYYATAEGMSELLKKSGYRIETTVTKGDPIVVGVRQAD